MNQLRAKLSSMTLFETILQKFSYTNHCINTGTRMDGFLISLPINSGTENIRRSLESKPGISLGKGRENITFDAAPSITVLSDKQIEKQNPARWSHHPLIFVQKSKKRRALQMQ